MGLFGGVDLISWFIVESCDHVTMVVNLLGYIEAVRLLDHKSDHHILLPHRFCLSVLYIFVVIFIVRCIG
jgi:hypothetical protein